MGSRRGENSIGLIRRSYPGGFKVDKGEDRNIVVLAEEHDSLRSPRATDCSLDESEMHGSTIPIPNPTHREIDSAGPAT